MLGCDSDAVVIASLVCTQFIDTIRSVQFSSVQFKFSVFVGNGQRARTHIYTQPKEKHFAARTHTPTKPKRSHTQFQKKTNVKARAVKNARYYICTHAYVRICAHVCVTQHQATLKSLFPNIKLNSKMLPFAVRIIREESRSTGRYLPLYLSCREDLNREIVF